MNTLVQAAAVIGPIVGAIMVLTLFFKLIGWIGRKSAPEPTRFAIRGVLDGTTPTTVRLRNGTILENVRIMGSTESAASKGCLPYELGRMMIIRYPDERHLLVQAKMIREIEVPPQAKA